MPLRPVRTLVVAVAGTAFTLPGAATLTSAAATTTAADQVPPATIVVCRVAYGDGEAVTVDFDEYVREVLPEEFGSAGPPAYLEVGAAVVKAYAWYHLANPVSSRCHITDSARHQHYRPGAGVPRSTHTDSAVDRTWHLRLDAAGSPLHAQYCSRWCHLFRTGRYLDQREALDQARRGWNVEQILRHHYRAVENLSLRDWRDGHEIAFAGRQPFVLEDGAAPRLTAAVAGVAPGDERAIARLAATCTLGGSNGTHAVSTATVTGDGGDPRVVFDDTAGLHGCREDDIPVTVTLEVNGWPVRSDRAAVVRPWQSAKPRTVRRIADTDDPVAGSVALSQEVFADAAGSPSGGAGGLVNDLLGTTRSGPERRAARAVVVARADRFADALPATGLAGPSAPILLNPGGEKARLHGAVADEIDRVLGGTGLVHLVGGPVALPQAIRGDLERRGYTVRRHAGATRIQTALAVADAILEERGTVRSVMVARAFPDSSAGWADAVTGGAYAAARRHPVLLTAPDRLDDAVEEWIEASQASEAILLGGPAAVSDDAPHRLDIARVTRVGGAARDATAVAVADTLWRRDGAPTVRAALLVDTFNEKGWPFALAGAVYAANRGAPQLAVGTVVPRSTSGAWLDSHAGLPALIAGGDGIVAGRIDRDAGGR